jgi:phage-related tail protein
MAIFEDAAEQLVVKLKGLDGEMEQARQRISDIKDHLQSVCDDFDEHWQEMAEKVASVVAKVGDESEETSQSVDEGLSALAEAKGTVEGGGQEVEAELASAQEGVRAYGEHATGMEEPVETLVVDGVEVPAQALAQRAQEVEGELQQALSEAREFLTDEVGGTLKELQDEIRERCEELHTTLTVECANALQSAFDDWSSKMDEVEELVEQQAFTAAPPHAGENVTYALTACSDAQAQQLATLRDLVNGLVGVLDELKTEVGEAATDVAVEGADALAQGMDGLRQSLASAGTALDSVRDLLASYSFVG